MSLGLRSRWLQVRPLPGALVCEVVVYNTVALVAQWQSRRLLSGGVQVRVLPGALKENAEVRMQNAE